MVGLPNFLSRMTLRPLGPSVAFTAFESFSTPRRSACRAFSSNCSCLAAIVFLVESYWLSVERRLTNDAEDVVLAHDQVGLTVHLDLGAAVFGDKDLVALLHGELDLLAVIVHFAGAERYDAALLRLFLGGIGDDDPALFGFFLFDRLHKHAISEGSYINCHVLVTPSSALVG